MGPTGILPGATYTTIDHDDRNQDFLQDVLEAYLETDEKNARKAAHQKTMTDELKAAGTHPALTGQLQCTQGQASDAVSGCQCNRRG